MESGGRVRRALHALSVTADGVVGRRPDGRFGFVRSEQTVVVEVDAEDEMAAAAGDRFLLTFDNHNSVNGIREIAFTISRETLVGSEFAHGMTLDDYVHTIGLHTGGAIRASLDFAAEFADLAGTPDDLPERRTC